MVYKEFMKIKRQYDSMQSICDSILREKEALFTKTQPNAIRVDKMHVSGGKLENGFDKYMVECEKRQIDQRLNEAISILRARGELLSLKEQELRKSKELDDIIFVMKILDQAKVSTIAMALGYSESQVYRILEKIQRS